MAFCKFRVMDRCTKSQQPCLFDEECFEPQDEPIARARALSRFVKAKEDEI